MTPASDPSQKNLSLHRIEVGCGDSDTVAEGLIQRLSRPDCAPALVGLVRVEVATLCAGLEPRELDLLAEMLGHPVNRPVRIDQPLVQTGFDWAVEVGFLPGVTDNVARTISKMLSDVLGRSLRPDESVHSSRLLLLRGQLDESQLASIARVVANPLVERVHIKSAADYGAEGGMDKVAPRVALAPHPQADLVDLEVDDAELERLGKEGVPERPELRGAGVTRRGPLALDLQAMQTIRDHFKKLGRRPTDVELESIAQNWSEHCRHLLFNSPLDEIDRGLFRHYIRGATEKIRTRRAREGQDLCVSVFTDNAGGIAFDDDWLVTDKVETHNSPSALDPFGGALTGILGVNRDALGFGLGALPILNRYGFCLPWPGDRRELYRAPGKEGPLLTPELLAEGIFKGVEVGGNCCGIPTPQGFWLFHEGYRAKPLVFVGTLGLIPRRGADGRELWRKQARPGDRIVMAGGRVGLDGIHGATFSSEALASGSPATAVQIGDPIGQKLLLDALVQEARDRALYTSLTDNGAGGLSCSVPEMARESGGCRLDLDRVPLKYPGMAPWQIWVSESQERMTLAVPPEHIEELIGLFAKRDVEATDLGEFPDDGHCTVTSRGSTVLELELGFLLDGWPLRHLETRAPARTLARQPTDASPRRVPARPAAATEAPVDKAASKPIPSPSDSATFRAVPLHLAKAGPVDEDSDVDVTNSGDSGADPTVEPIGLHLAELESTSKLEDVEASESKEPVAPAPVPSRESDPKATLLKLLARPGLSSREELAMRFDHEVQGASVLKPLAGPGRVDADATAIRPLPHSWRAVAVSQGLCPTYTELDPYRMACWAVDAAVRPLVAIGARLEHIALLDNFCWCSPNEPERLWQLKEAARGCHDVAVAYGTPFISGKDSMHNDFRGFDADGKPVRLSIPPTLLVSSLAVLPDLRIAVSLDSKERGDAVYLAGFTHAALGGSAWQQIRIASEAEAVSTVHRERANEVPSLDAERARRLYAAHADAVQQGLVASSIALGAGGLVVAAARKALASGLGLRLWLEPIQSAGGCETEDETCNLFSESPARLLLTCRPAATDELERILEASGAPFARLGTVTREPELLVLAKDGRAVLQVPIEDLDAAYRTDWRSVR